jgi:hypothetical protein
MERVTFLVEDVGAAIPCLLNPDNVVIRRLAGLRTRRTAGGLVTGTHLSDDPLIATGGGRTEIELDLLFDVTLIRSSEPPANVQELTRPLWQLAENAAGAEGFGVPRVVRLVWGKTWNVPAVVGAISERFERFTITGIPERSWVRVRLIRVAEPQLSPEGTDTSVLAAAEAAFGTLSVPEDQITFHELIGGEDEPGERLDEIAARYYGEPALWRTLALYNGIVDPLRIPPRAVIRVPPLSALRGLM